MHEVEHTARKKAAEAREPKRAHGAAQAREITECQRGSDVQVVQNAHAAPETRAPDHGQRATHPTEAPQAHR